VCVQLLWCVCTSVCVCVPCACEHIHVHYRLHVCVHACEHVCEHASVHVCVCHCVYIYGCVCCSRRNKKNEGRSMCYEGSSAHYKKQCDSAKSVSVHTQITNKYPTLLNPPLAIMEGPRRQFVNSVAASHLLKYKSLPCSRGLGASNDLPSQACTK
jgi:hypothetical protein